MVWPQGNGQSHCYPSYPVAPLGGSLSCLSLSQFIQNLAMPSQIAAGKEDSADFIQHRPCTVQLSSSEQMSYYCLSLYNMR